MKDKIEALSALFSMSREAVVGVQNGVIAFMNASAVEAVGRDGTGERAEKLLPEHILDSDSETFLCSAVIGGKKAAVSASELDGIRIFLFTFQRKVQRPGDMHASLAPPIRVALTNLKLATERLSEAGGGDERLSYCASVLNHSYYELWRLLRNVSTANSLERGDTAYCPRHMDIAGLCRDVTAIAAVYAEKRGVALSFEPESGCVDCVADEQLIKQLFLNLLSNSLLHTGVGGTIKVSVVSGGRNVIISVDDSGEGIPGSVMPTVFCRWMQSRALTDTASGAGVGLSVARGIAELHGGALIIESRQGRGTAVRVMMPADNSPTLLFSQSQEEGYVHDHREEVMTFLSTWLPTEDYDKHPDE